MNEQQLIEGCKRENRLAQKELYDTYSRRMMGVCLRYVNDRETARDLLQDGFIKVFTHIHSYSGNGSFEGWMRKIFVNGALEYLRKSDVMRESVDLDNTAELSNPDASIISTLSANELIACIQELPAGFRSVFNLFAIEGFSHKEIGEVLQITESTSRSQYTRAKQLLQRKINELYQNER
ncbi:MAG: sigma-70 family RNA polymerase sigma factor [Tannerellaceae bacterium]|jgi:RNA polymerase sigma-70 factor (ECF subfamily)|nr:sigma-70 family RNA polymerase sigma factor [Tannerellaceae bacterium]